MALFLFIICVDFCLRRAIGGDENKLGFTLERRKSTRHEPIVLTNCDFLDDICLMSNNLESAQNLLKRVEDACF